METTNIILMPGLDGTGLLFNELIEQLCNESRVKCINLNELKGRSYSELAQEIAYQLPTQRFVLVAESYSGAIAYELFKLVPNKIEHLIFIASFVSRPSLMSKWAQFIPISFIHLLARRKWLVEVFCFGRTINDVEFSIFRSALAECPNDLIKKRLEYISNLQTPTEIFDIQTTYIRPKNDILISKTAVDTIQRLYPSTKVISLEGGHFIAQASSKRCAEVIKKMISTGR